MIPEARKSQETPTEPSTVAVAVVPLRDESANLEARTLIYMDDQKFQTLANQALESLNEKLGEAGDRYGFEADLQEGALKIAFDDPPARFVVSPNSPVKQIWVSALVRSFKLDWDEGAQAFVLGSTGETLEQLLVNAIGQQLGETVTL
jgi:iron donor protein CyaY